MRKRARRVEGLTLRIRAEGVENGGGSTAADGGGDKIGGAEALRQQACR